MVSVDTVARERLDYCWVHWRRDNDLYGQGAMVAMVATEER